MSYHTIAFYNLENLFDTKDDKYTNDDSFLPESEWQWTPKRYKKKLRKLGYAISNIGTKKDKIPPAIVGLSEVENKQVIEDLLASKFLKRHSYDIVHYDSPDERGIDVGFIYDTNRFKVLNSETYSIDLFNEKGERDYTRDTLLVKGNLNNETLYILVNHWSSRREGEEISEPKRIKASEKVSDIINAIEAENSNAKIIIMGDFNDNPDNESITRLTNTHNLYNPMAELFSQNKGSVSYQKQWNLFDQILFTTNFFEFKKGAHSFSKAEVFDADFLKQYKGKYKGSPFRTFVWKFYKGGYSDHFPVYLRLKEN